MVERLQISSIKTPLGSIALIADSSAADSSTLVAAGFDDPADLHARLSPTLRSRGLIRTKSISGVSDELLAYLDGELRALDRIKVSQPGGPFSQQAWKAMRKIKPGKTISYAELAANSGSPRAVRAAGTACARNLIAPIIPCHRIVRSDGSLGGYGYGLPTKTWLLKHEGAL